MIGAVIQARMSSSRLPGKVLAEIMGKPMLYHQLERLKTSKKLEEIVVAATSNPLDDPIEEFCKEYGVKCFRGSEEDVLKRFIDASKKYNLSIVVRVCSDSPLIDIASMDEMIQILIEQQVDLVSVDPKETSLLDGFEVTNLAFLEKIYGLCTEEYHKEHVTYLAKEDTKIGKVLYYDPPLELRFKDIRVTVDTEKDLEFIREVFKWLYEEGKIIDVRRLEKLPFYIFRINQGVMQKDAVQRNWKISVIVDEINDALVEIQQILEQKAALKINFLTSEPKEYLKAEEAIYFKMIDKD